MQGAVRRPLVWLVLSCSLAALVAWGSAFAEEGPSYPLVRRSLDDAADAMPASLASGQVLPGERGAVACPATVDLAQPIGLQQAVDLALCNSPQLQQSWAAIKAQAAELGQARSAYLPTLNASVSKLHSETRYPDVPQANVYENGHTVSASFDWRLFDFGARAANEQAAQQMLAAALATHAAKLQETLGTVVGAYFDAFTARGSMQARAEAAMLAQQVVQATQRRQAKGAAAASDVLQATAALAKARLTARRAEGAYRKSMAVLRYAMGVAPDLTLALAQEPAVVSAEALADLQRWLERAQRRHPAIVAARAQWLAAKTRVAVAKDEGLPSIDLTGNLYRNGYPNQGLQATRSTASTIGLTLTIPLFDGFSHQYKVRQAAAQAEQGEAQLHDTEYQVLMGVVKAYADAQSSLANLDASATLQHAAEASMASASNRYEKGASDVLELISAEQSLADAEQQRVQCLAEWRAARLALFASAGVLGRDLVARSQADAAGH